MRPAAPTGQRHARLTRDIAVAILAAGLSRRMGWRNKLLLPMAGEPLVARSLQAFEPFFWHQRVAVVGADPAVASLMERCGYRTVYNLDHQTGHMYSLRVALEALRPGFSAVMVALADQPLLCPNDVLRLARAFANGPPEGIVVPLHRGRPGNPRVLAGFHVERLCAAGSAMDARRYIDAHPEQVHWVPMRRDHVVRDVDDPTAYRRIKHRLMARRRRLGGGP